MQLQLKLQIFALFFNLALYLSCQVIHVISWCFQEDWQF
jgi:hypothetical protein